MVPHARLAHARGHTGNFKKASQDVNLPDNLRLTCDGQVIRIG